MNAGGRAEMARIDGPNVLDVSGLHPHQIRHLMSLRDDMLGWKRVGYAVEIDDGDWYLTEDADRTVDIAKALLFQSASEASNHLNVYEDESRRVVTVFRKGDDFETVVEEP
jgi:hypothetical protein